MKRITLLAALALLLPLAWAAHALVSQHSNGCRTITLCNAKTSTGDCGYVSMMDGFYTHELSSVNSVAAAYGAKICMSPDGATTTCYELSPAITIADTAPKNYWDGQIKNYWVNVTSGNATGTLSVYDYTCPLAQ